MSVCCECCVLSGRGLCDELATRPEESYRLWCVVVCDLETSWLKSHTQLVVTELNRRRITGCISYMPLIVTVRHDCWMSSDRLQCSGRLKKDLVELMFSQGSVAGKLQLTKVRRVYTATVGEQNFIFSDQDVSGKHFGFLCFPYNERVLVLLSWYYYYYYYYYHHHHHHHHLLYAGYLYTYSWDKPCP